MISERAGVQTQRYDRGLEGLVAGPTAISHIDGSAGRLLLRGYPIEALAGHVSFEAAAYLVLFGELPEPVELARWRAALFSYRRPPARALAVLETLPAAAHPLAQHRTMLAVAACEVSLAPPEPAADKLQLPARLLSWSAVLAAAAIRHLQGAPPVLPDGRPGYAESFLQQTLDREPAAEELAAFEVSLVLQLEHGLHAAALAALVVASTGADLGSALLAGMGALSGERHGGANQLAFEMLAGLEGPEHARSWARAQLASPSRFRFPGFGHRIYKCPDPRVRLLEPHARALLQLQGMGALWQSYLALRQEVEGALGPRGIFANIDSVTGLVYHPLGLPPSAFTIPFCLAIQVGWMAHCLEYLPGGPMIEPGAVYLPERG